MLNSNNIRELAYLTLIDSISPIEGSDNCESANIGGWHIMVRKGTFVAGDPAVYFEVDSHLDTNKPEFAFLEKKHGNIKCQKYTFGGKGCFYSQGLLMPVTDFGWTINKVTDNIVEVIDENNNVMPIGTFLTERLGVTYAVAEDNQRKSASVDKYTKMAQRNPNIFKHKWARWFMRRNWGRKLMFFFFGKKRDKKTGWPSWVVKTDEERIQNCPWYFPACGTEWITTEKVDGTSTTFTMKGFGRKREFYVCSRNVVFDKPDKKCFYETNVYTEMAEKYNMQEVLAQMLDKAHSEDNSIEFITIQGETYGGNIQRRNYSTDEHDMRVFNVIFGHKDGSTKRLNPMEGVVYVEGYGLKYVPIVETNVTLPASCDEVVTMAHGKSKIDGELREGLVFRSIDGKQSFKAVDPEYLIKFHG